MLKAARASRQTGSICLARNHVRSLVRKPPITRSMTSAGPGLDRPSEAEASSTPTLSVDAPVLGRKPGEQAAVPAFKRGYILHAATPPSGGVDWRLDRLAARKTRPARAAGARYRPNIAAMKLIE